MSTSSLLGTNKAADILFWVLDNVAFASKTLMSFYGYKFAYRSLTPFVSIVILYCVFITESLCVQHSLWSGYVDELPLDRRYFWENVVEKSDVSIAGQLQVSLRTFCIAYSSLNVLSTHTASEAS